MEDTLRAFYVSFRNSKYIVLILVLMEDTLRGLIINQMIKQPCLNPCFNGRYSQR